MSKPLFICALALVGTLASRARPEALAAPEAVVRPGTVVPAATEFSVRVQNVSTENTLRLAGGGTAPAPTAPVVWLLHTTPDPLFTDGAKDRGEGLESLAEDGSPAALAAALKDRKGIAAVGAVTMPVGASEPGPILPGQAYEFVVSAQPAQRLTLAMMFGQSNDLFYAPEGKGIRLFHRNGRPVEGDITSELVLWDAGTEVNQEPGSGPDQAPRQAADDTGASEDAPVRRIGDVEDGYRYPKVKDVLRVTVGPRRNPADR